MRSDLTLLPAGVREAAVVLENGEVMWPWDSAREAIAALADAGFFIVGLDARELTGEFETSELPISSWSGSDVASSRDAAFDALAEAERISGWHSPHILVTWEAASAAMT